MRFLVCFSVSLYTESSLCSPWSKPWWEVRWKTTSVSQQTTSAVACGEATGSARPHLLFWGLTWKSFSRLITTSASHLQSELYLHRKTTDIFILLFSNRYWLIRLLNQTGECFEVCNPAYKSCFDSYFDHHSQWKGLLNVSKSAWGAQDELFNSHRL